MEEIHKKMKFFYTEAPNDDHNIFGKILGSNRTFGDLVFTFLDPKTFTSLMICSKWLLKRAIGYVDEIWKEQLHINADTRTIQKLRILEACRDTEKDQFHTTANELFDISTALRFMSKISRSLILKCSGDGLIIAASDAFGYIRGSVTCTKVLEHECTSGYYLFTDVSLNYNLCTSLCLQGTCETLFMYVIDKRGKVSHYKGIRHEEYGVKPLDYYLKLQSTTHETDSPDLITSVPWISCPSTTHETDTSVRAIRIPWTLIDSALYHEEDVPSPVLYLKVRNSQLDIMVVSGDAKTVVGKYILAETDHMDMPILRKMAKLAFIAMEELLDEYNPMITFSHDKNHIYISYSVLDMFVKATTPILELEDTIQRMCLA